MNVASHDLETDLLPSEGKERNSKSRGSRGVATIEKNLNSITVKHFDLSFDVDPLFQKMSQKFDEGRARGMLLNNLAVHDGCRVLFDTTGSWGEEKAEKRDEFESESITSREVCQALQDADLDSRQISPGLDCLYEAYEANVSVDGDAQVIKSLLSHFIYSLIHHQTSCTHVILCEL